MVLRNFRASIHHSRILPKKNSFTYNVNYCYGTVSDYKNFDSSLYSYNKPNIFSIEDLEINEKLIKQTLYKHGFQGSIENIYYLSILKMWGYAFNPVSFWFIYQDKQLKSVVSQVSNTFGEKHFYLVNEKNFSPIKATKWLQINKRFHVSPFFKRDGEYEFKFAIQAEKIKININYFHEKNLQLVTSMTGNFTGINLAYQMFSNPFNTFKVILLIHWQALKLYLKGTKIISKPKQYEDKISN